MLHNTRPTEESIEEAIKACLVFLQDMNEEYNQQERLSFVHGYLACDNIFTSDDQIMVLWREKKAGK